MGGAATKREKHKNAKWMKLAKQNNNYLTLAMESSGNLGKDFHKFLTSFATVVVSRRIAQQGREQSVTEQEQQWLVKRELFAMTQSWL